MQTVSEATFDLFVVPDYVCSGVVEHYVKVSGVITFPHRGTKDIFSVIVNKKTGNLQRQNRVDQFGTVRQMSTIVFGQGYRKCVFSRGMIDLAKLYQTLDDGTKKFLTDAMLSLPSAMYRTLDSDANMTTEEKNGMWLIKERISLYYKDANKVTGFMLFIAVPMTFWSIIPISIAAIVATFAAIQEGHFIRTKNNLKRKSQK